MTGVVWTIIITIVLIAIYDFATYRG